MPGLSEHFELKRLSDAARLAQFVTRPSNPVTGAAIPVHPGQPAAPPIPPPGATATGNSVSSVPTPMPAGVQTVVESATSTINNIVNTSTTIQGVFPVPNYPSAQAAINAAVAAGGGIVWFPPGTYVVSLVLQNATGVTLQGAGIGSTILRAASDIADVVLLTGPSTAAITVADMTINGPANAACIHTNTWLFSQTVTLLTRNVTCLGGKYGLQCTKNSDVINFNLVCYNFTSAGIRCDGDGESPAAPMYDSNGVSRKVYSGNTQAGQTCCNVITYGFIGGSGSGTDAAPNHILDLVGVNGFYMRTADVELCGSSGSSCHTVNMCDAANATVQNLKFEGVTEFGAQGHGWFIGGGSGSGVILVELTNCDGLSNTLAGLCVHGGVNELYLKGFRAYSNSSNGITIGDNAGAITFVQISGGLSNANGVGAGGYGLYVAASTAGGASIGDLIVEGTVFSGNGAAGYLIATGAGAPYPYIAHDIICVGNTSGAGSSSPVAPGPSAAQIVHDIVDI